MVASEYDSGEGVAARREVPALLTVGGVAALLACSARHVRRLVDSGRMPQPLRLGAAVRWRRGELLDWIFRGCPACDVRGATCQGGAGR